MMLPNSHLFFVFLAFGAQGLVRKHAALARVAVAVGTRMKKEKGEKFSEQVTHALFGCPMVSCNRRFKVGFAAVQDPNLKFESFHIIERRKLIGRSATAQYNQSCQNGRNFHWRTIALPMLIVKATAMAGQPPLPPAVASPSQSLSIGWIAPSNEEYTVIYDSTNASFPKGLSAPQEFPGSSGTVTNLNLAVTNNFYGQTIASNGAVSAIAYMGSYFNAATNAVTNVVSQAWLMVGYSTDLTHWTNLLALPCSNSMGFYRIGIQKRYVAP